MSLGLTSTPSPLVALFRFLSQQLSAERVEKSSSDSTWWCQGDFLLRWFVNVLAGPRPARQSGAAVQTEALTAVGFLWVAAEVIGRDDEAMKQYHELSSFQPQQQQPFQNQLCGKDRTLYHMAEVIVRRSGADNHRQWWTDVVEPCLTLMDATLDASSIHIFYDAVATLLKRNDILLDEVTTINDESINQGNGLCQVQVGLAQRVAAACSLVRRCATWARRSANQRTPSLAKSIIIESSVSYPFPSHMNLVVDTMHACSKFLVTTCLGRTGWIEDIAEVMSFAAVNTERMTPSTTAATSPASSEVEQGPGQMVENTLKELLQTGTVRVEDGVQPRGGGDGGSSLLWYDQMFSHRTQIQAAERGSNDPVGDPALPLQLFFLHEVVCSVGGSRTTRRRQSFERLQRIVVELLLDRCEKSAIDCEWTMLSVFDGVNRRLVVMRTTIEAEVSLYAAIARTAVARNVVLPSGLMHRWRGLLADVATQSQIRITNSSICDGSTPVEMLVLPRDITSFPGLASGCPWFSVLDASFEPWRRILRTWNNSAGCDGGAAELLHRVSLQCSLATPPQRKLTWVKDATTVDILLDGTRTVVLDVPHLHVLTAMFAECPHFGLVNTPPLSLPELEEIKSKTLSRVQKELSLLHDSNRETILEHMIAKLMRVLLNDHCSPSSTEKGGGVCHSWDSLYALELWKSIQQQQSQSKKQAGGPARGGGGRARSVDTRLVVRAEAFLSRVAKKAGALGIRVREQQNNYLEYIKGKCLGGLTLAGAQRVVENDAILDQLLNSPSSDPSLLISPCERELLAAAASLVTKGFLRFADASEGSSDVDTCRLEFVAAA